MLLSVSADVKQAKNVQVKFQRRLSKMKVRGTNKTHETKSEARACCVKRAPVNPEKNISG